jgi:hypothetical protein
MPFFLLQMGLEFAGIEHPLRKVALSQHVYVNCLSQNEFAQVLTNLRNAALAVIWMVNRRLKEEPAPVAGDDTVN